MKLLLPISTASKQQLSDALLTMTLWQSTFLSKDFGMHTPSQLKFMKDTQTFGEVIRLVEKLNAAQKLTATLTPSMVSMMTKDERCFVVFWLPLP